MKNEEIRRHAKAKGVFLWELAARVGVTDSTFSRKLRKKFTDEETAEMVKLIDLIAAEKEGN